MSFPLDSARTEFRVFLFLPSTKVFLPVSVISQKCVNTYYQYYDTFLWYCTDSHNTVIYHIMSRNIFTKLKFTPYNSKMNNKKGYGQIISRLRIERGLTQKQLAERMDIPASLITDYERGKLRLHDEIIVKLVHALQVSANEILDLEANNLKTVSTSSLRIMKRVKKIEKLPKFKQKIILQMIDGYTRGEANI